MMMDILPCSGWVVGSFCKDVQSLSARRSMYLYGELSISFCSSDVRMWCNYFWGSDLSQQKCKKSLLGLALAALVLQGHFCWTSRSSEGQVLYFYLRRPSPGIFGEESCYIFFFAFFLSLKKSLIFCNVHFPRNGSFPVHSPTLSSLLSLHLLRFWNIFVGETWLIDFNEFPSAVSFHLEIEQGKYRSWVWTTGYTPIYAIYWNP